MNRLYRRFKRLLSKTSGDGSNKRHQVIEAMADDERGSPSRTQEFSACRHHTFSGSHSLAAIDHSLSGR